MVSLLENSCDRRIDAAPLGEQLRQHLLAVLRQAVEALVAFAFLAPLARQEPLRLEPPEQWVERAFVDREPVLAEELAQRVAVLLGAERGQHRHDQAAAAQFEAKVFK